MRNEQVIPLNSSHLIKYIFTLAFTIIAHTLYSQPINTPEEAIEIAIKNGLRKGIDEPYAILNEDSIWQVRCLLCDDDYDESQIIYIDAVTGEIQDNLIGLDNFPTCVDKLAVKSQIKQTKNWDNIPLFDTPNKPYMLTTVLNEGNVFNPNISPDNKHVAFEYGYREIKKIGIVEINGEGIQSICEDCDNPQWAGNRWIMYCKENKIYKKNIQTNEEVCLIDKTGNYDGFQVSPNNKWIAYTSREVWETETDSLGNPVRLYSFINGEGQELCLLSTDGKQKKFITQRGGYVNTQFWSENGDTLLFYIGNIKHNLTNPDDTIIEYSEIFNKNDFALADLKKTIKGMFPYKYNCKIYMIEASNMEPKSLLVDNPGRYDNLCFSTDMKYFIYINKSCKDCFTKLWALKLK